MRIAIDQGVVCETTSSQTNKDHHTSVKEQNGYYRSFGIGLLIVILADITIVVVGYLLRNEDKKTETRIDRTEMEVDSIISSEINKVAISGRKIKAKASTAENGNTENDFLVEETFNRQKEEQYCLEIKCILAPN